MLHEAEAYDQPQWDRVPTDWDSHRRDYTAECCREKRSKVQIRSVPTWEFAYEWNGGSGYATLDGGIPEPWTPATLPVAVHLEFQQTPG